MKRMFLVKLLFSISIIEICGAFDVTLTTNVSPGGRECFAHKVAADSQYELEYQVVSGGELDITFSLYTADGIKVIDDVKRSSKVYRDQAAEDGEVEFCFDNSFSHFSTKAVFFHLKVAEEETATTAVMDDIAEAQELLPFEITYENFKTSTYQVSNNLRRSVELQRVFSHIELRDRSIQEYNFERVNFWSGLQLILMLSVAVINIFVIRHLFSDKHSTSSSASKLRT